MLDLERAPAATPLAAPALERAPDEEGARRPPRALACATCRHVITSSERRVSVDGAHVHERVNPHGFAFRFGCFAGAPGCRSRGVPSKQHTWFAGYFWQVAECGGCASHLGWLFFSTDHEFHGLVLDQLVEIEEPAPRG